MSLTLKKYHWQENGSGRYGGAKGSGASRPDQKFGPFVGPFGVNCYLGFDVNCNLKNFGP